MANKRQISASFALGSDRVRGCTGTYFAAVLKVGQAFACVDDWLKEVAV